jgi:hypothetical protein
MYIYIKAEQEVGFCTKAHFGHWLASRHLADGRKQLHVLKIMNRFQSLYLQEIEFCTILLACFPAS